MREPRRFPRPRRHVTPSQKPSSPEKLTRPIPQRSAPPPRLAAERLHPQSRKTCRPSETHTFAIPPEERAAPAARGRTVASTNQENMSRKSPATATATSHSQSRKTCRPSEKHTFAIPKGARRPRGSRSNGCVHKSGKHVAKIPCNRIHKAKKHVALQKNIHSPFPKGARRPAARGRTVASTKQENMSRKSPATAFTKQKNMSPFRKTYIRHPPKERAASCGSRSNGCVHKSGKHVAKIPCNRNRNRLDDCSCLLLICYRTDGNIVWVLRKS